MKATRSLRRRAVSLIAASVVLFAACGGGSESSDTTTADNPLRIVSLSPTATEMLYAIGAGDQVVAVDSLSTFPEEVGPKVTKISAYEPSAEAILAYEPDVVLISNDMNKITEQLKTADPDIEVWTGAAAATLDDVYAQITQLGELTGRADAAGDVIADMKKRIDAAIPATLPADSVKVFYELDNTYYSITSNTFVGALLTKFGFKSIADGVEAGNDYPQLSAEAIVAADPAIIFLADTKCCQQSKETVAARPGWDGMSAVRNNMVVELDDDIASRWGPRIVDLIEQFAAALESLQKQG